MTSIAVVLIAIVAIGLFRAARRPQCQQAIPDPLCSRAKPCVACFRDGVRALQAGMERPKVTAPQRRKDVLRLRTVKPGTVPVVMARRRA